jgi:hypothetical protein
LAAENHVLAACGDHSACFIQSRTRVNPTHMNTDLQTGRRPRDDSLLDAGHLATVYLVAFWCTYRIGSLLFSRRIGVWAAILVGLSTDYVFCSVEFRTDNLY